MSLSLPNTINVIENTTKNFKVTLNYNASSELIWIYWDDGSNVWKQQITDTTYTGGTGTGDITRTKVFNRWTK